MVTSLSNLTKLKFQTFTLKNNEYHIQDSLAMIYLGFGLNFMGFGWEVSKIINHKF